jgi:methylglutaconyl-CoA hydratase
MSEGSALVITRDDRGVTTVTMNRPDVRNAFDDRLLDELADAVDGLTRDDTVRVVVLTGAGSSFSAGADLEWMRAMKDNTFEENVADTSRVNVMLRALWDLPKPVIGRINGHAMGGGTGLVAVCDVAIAADDALFGFTEVGLGLAPAVISPYVVRKIGPSAARALFVTGERFDAERARADGLVHQVVPPDRLDEAVEEAVARCLRAGPEAIGAAKSLVDLAMRSLDQATAETPAIIARLRVGDEGQEGMQAFFDRRAPAWAPGEAT